MKATGLKCSRVRTIEKDIQSLFETGYCDKSMFVL